MRLLMQNSHYSLQFMPSHVKISLFKGRKYVFPSSRRRNKVSDNTKTSEKNPKTLTEDEAKNAVGGVARRDPNRPWPADRNRRRRVSGWSGGHE